MPPDSDGDVGSNHYIESVNSSIRIHDKSGNVLAGPITYNSFFFALGPSTPCGAAANDGDGVVFYDHIADRWIVSDFAFNVDTTTGPYYQCIGVSKTGDPVGGGWYLYAVEVDPANPKNLGDYPKFGLWPDAYYMSVNLFDLSQPTATQFQGVRVFAFDRNAMINGGSANAVAFSIGAADLGDQYSLLPATFRTGSPPPAGQPEWFMDVNSSATAGTVETEVFVRRFHVDFVTPANSTFGVGAGHTPDGIVTVNGFVDAFTSTTENIVPNGTATANQRLDTLGDKLMYPLAYQNLSGTESIYASQTVNNNQNGTGPTAVRWYQFDMTGNTIPATPVQQQSFNNGADGLWRWMPSINVDGEGNVAIGYSTSSTTLNPELRYAGRLAGDPLNDMGQGEATLIAAGGHQTSTSGRWGDYSATFVDPQNPCTFWHTGEYYTATTAANWATRIGLFKVNGGTCTAAPVPAPTPPLTTPSPTASPTPSIPPTPPPTTPTPTPSPTPSPTPPVSDGPVTVTATAGTTGPTDYATVAAALAAINAGTHQGDITVWVMGDTTETVPAVLNASGSGSASYTSVLMLPNGTRTVSGAIAAGSPLIDLNGANNVRIDGYGQLTLSNITVSATASTSTVRFINGASNDTLANCTILGSSTSAVGTAGGNVLFSTSTAAGGNNNNLVIGNDMGPAGANLPTKCVFSAGTAAKSNTNDVVSNNTIHDFFSATVSVSGISFGNNNDSCRISSNRVFQTATRTFTGTALRYSGITVSGAANASTNISFNVIGFGAANGTGTTTITGSTNEFRGIDAPSTTATTITSIQGNVISGINQTTARNLTATASAPFIGMVLGTTAGTFDIGSVAGNTFGSLDGSSSIVIAATSTTAGNAPVIGIYDFSFDDDIIANNSFGSITINSGGSGTTVGFRGILNSGTAGQAITVTNNTIASISDTIVGNYAVYGIQNAGADLFANGNVIRNMSCSSNGAIVAMSGIISGTANAGVSEITGNTVHSLNVSAGAGAGAIYGIDMTLSSNANVIERNFVNSFSATSTASGYQLFGIVKRGAGSATVQNNMVRLGIDAAGNSLTNDLSIIGIRDIAGGIASNFYFNSVYIGGSGVTATASTYGLLSDFATTAVNTRNFKDNILWNARSTTSGAGKNYAIRVAGTAPNPVGLTSNYNDLYATGTAGFVGQYNLVDQATLANWQTATGQDANSISADPLFANPTGTAATVDLHIQNGSPAIGAGIPAAGTWNDFDLDIRNPSNPDIGADERNSSVASVTITKTADAASVNAGSQIGFTVTITNSTAGAATGLAVTDNLPAGTDVNWTIDAGNTDPGWSVSGSPPNQSLVYSPTTLAANTSTTAHVVSSTTVDSCGTYDNTAGFSTNNDGSGVASASLTVRCITVTVQTNPAGLAFNVDGTDYNSAQTFTWAPGSSHTITTTSPQSGDPGVRYVWKGWSDGGAISHSVAPTQNKIYTATFTTQYFLTMNAGTGGTVSPVSSWKASGLNISISATPSAGYSFNNWTGSGSGSFTGTDNPASITMNGPITETATFNPPTPTPTPTPTVQVTVQTTPGGLTFNVDGTDYSATQTFTWVKGSPHTIATTSPQSGDPGVRYVWNGWSDGGAISHSVAPTQNKVYTATFTTQYFLTMNAGTGGTVSPVSGWKASGLTISISATASNNYTFSGWTGSGTGSYTGANNPASITMNGPITETATFTHN